MAGPWRHRYVAANGARFHVAEAGPADGPLVLLLHGFPEFWWAWRRQLPVLAALRYRAVAMDLRGYGGSDKTPRGYDPATLSRDVVGVVRSLGARRAVLVGQSWGAYIAWTTAALHRSLVRGLAAVAAPHPLAMLSRPPLGLVHHLLSMQPPVLPERRIMADQAVYVETLLRRWSAPGSGFPDAEAAGRYRGAMSVWPSPHCALEYHRWVVRSRLRRDGRWFVDAMRRPVTAPVLEVVGAHDPVVRRAQLARSPVHVDAPYAVHTVDDAGHFPHEEQPEQVNAVLLEWLQQLPKG
ncbi:MAG: alpha/beta hydrolase [Actinomycetota bacterium]|nr:alpha/beta hydrolase [Actinomycetota bacterium]